MPKKITKKAKLKVAKKRVTKKANQSTEVRVVIEQKPVSPISLAPRVIDEALIPEKDGKKLMLTESWLSTKQVLKVLQKTPPIHVQTRPGKGGMNFKYVSGTYMKKMLNFTFGWNWDFQIVSKEIYGLEQGHGQIVIVGRLTVKDDHGHQVVKEQVGQAEIKYLKGTKIPVSIGNDFKSAATDALKKCASELGFASDVYGENEFKEIIEEFPQSTVAVQNVAANPKAPETEYQYYSENGTMISKAEYDYSMKIYGIPLSRAEQDSGKFRPRTR